MKSTIAVLFWTLMLWAMQISARCQELPDTPTIECSAATIDESGAIFYRPISCATLPAVEWHIVPPPQKKVTFWTMRKSFKDPPLRTNRQYFSQKSTWIAAGTQWSAMIVACSRKGTGEHFDSEVPAQAGVFALAYLGGRFFSQPHAVFTMLGAAGHYMYTARK